MSKNRVERILFGIDMTETDHPEGWWETSVGAEFGAKKLAELKAAMEVARSPQSESERRWNATGDVEPPADTPILVHTYDGIQSTAMWKGGSWFVDAYDPSDGATPSISHWMPLPEDPK